MFDGNVIAVNAEHPLKTQSPRAVILFGSVIDVNNKQSLKT